MLTMFQRYNATHLAVIQTKLSEQIMQVLSLIKKHHGIDKSNHLSKCRFYSSNLSVVCEVKKQKQSVGHSNSGSQSLMQWKWHCNGLAVVSVIYHIDIVPHSLYIGTVCLFYLEIGTSMNCWLEHKVCKMVNHELNTYTVIRKPPHKCLISNREKV